MGAKYSEQGKIIHETNIYNSLHQTKLMSWYRKQLNDTFNKHVKDTESGWQEQKHCAVIDFAFQTL